MVEAVTDVVVVRFVNEQVRVAAEKLRASKSELEGLLSDWSSGVGELVPEGGGLIRDGREVEGVQNLSTDEVRALVQICQMMYVAVNDPQISVLLAKACVRPLRVEG